MHVEVHPVKEKTKEFRTMYDIIFELVRLGAVLTGSRAFGLECQNSDWDFVIDIVNANKDSDVWKLFRVEGTGDTHYKDGNTVRVLIATRYPIHVQVSKDIEKKLKAQELLMNMPPIMQERLLKMDSKMGRRRVWDWALEQVGGKN